MKYRTRILTAALAAATLAGVSAQAGNVTWTGSAADGLWDSSNNWDLVRVPTASLSDWATIANGDTVAYMDGMTNSVQHHSINGGSTMNFSGGYLNDNKSGNTRRTYIGTSGAGTLNQTGGDYEIGHMVRLGIGGTGTMNLSGGIMNIYRGGNSSFGNPGVSLSIGNSSGLGVINITNSTFGTRTGVEVGVNGTFHVYGGASTIDLGGHGGNGDGDWYQMSNGVLRLSISTNGLSPIVFNDTGETGSPSVNLYYGSKLDVAFVDGAMETNFWPVLDVSGGGLLNNEGLFFADGMDTNGWGFITSNNTLYVGYGLGWSAGGNVLTPPSAGRTLYWTGAVSSDSSNPSNWVENLDGSYTNATDWAIYKEDSLQIAEYHAVDNTTNYVCDYNGDAPFVGQNSLAIGIARTGTLNINSGSLTFTKNAGSVQTIGGQNSAGNGTLNVNGGSITLNATRLGLAGAQGNINVNGGTLTISRGWGNSSMWIGYGNTGGTGTGTVTVTGGRIFTRGDVKLGALGDPGVFCVEGSASTDIGIGGNSSLDGAWYQYSNSVLKCRIDAGGITPVNVVVKDAPLGGNDGHVYFYPGSKLDLDWMPGVTNFGTFKLMHWDGNLVSNYLALADSVDTSVWSFEITDDNSDGTNDTLWATAYGETGNGTPIPWLNQYGLGTGDDTIDNDGDGMLTWEEYQAGTDPTNAASLLIVTSLEGVAGGNYAITWQSVTNRSYSIITNANLMFPNSGTAASGIPGDAGETTVTSSIPPEAVLFLEVGTSAP